MKKIKHQRRFQKSTPSQVAQIKRRLAVGKQTRKEIAELYGCSASNIDHIKAGRVWPEVVAATKPEDWDDVQQPRVAPVTMGCTKADY